MKKYHQLILLVISVISLSLFLIYRHEYNRLHYVLEVFNFFGQPCNISNLQQTEDILSHHDWGPRPIWQEYDTGYVYSAFLTKKNEAKALAVLTDDKQVAPHNCYFWFEDKKKPTIGKFRFSKLGNDEGAHLNLYSFICESGATEHLPFAVSFSNKVKKENDLKKVMLGNSIKHQIYVNTTICVSPSVYSKKRLLEFLSYHKLIGVDSFIFYNRDIPHRLVKILTNLSTRLGFHFAFLPWNFPRTDGTITRTIVENDCLLRTYQQNIYAVTLEINEYIVPGEVYSFNALISKIHTISERISIPVQRFCISSGSESSKPISMMNTDVTEDFTYNNVRYVYRNDQRKEDTSTQSLGAQFLAIHKYIRCSTSPSKTFSDKTILRYSTDLSRSTLFQLYLHSQI